MQAHSAQHVSLSRRICRAAPTDQNSKTAEGAKWYDAGAEQASTLIAGVCYVVPRQRTSIFASDTDCLDLAKPEGPSTPVAGAASAPTAVPDVNPKLREKTQKEMGKAMMALRKNDFPTARIHLDILQRLAPDRAEVSFLLGLYASETGDAEHAKSYWLRTLELEPQHFRALLFLVRNGAARKEF